MGPESTTPTRTGGNVRSIWSRIWPKRQVSVAEIRRSQTLGVAALLFATLTVSLHFFFGAGISENVLFIALLAGMSSWRSCSEVKQCRDRMPGSLYQRVEAFRGSIFLVGVLTIFGTQSFLRFESDIALIGPLLVYVWFAASIGWWVVNDSVLARFAEGD